MQINFLSDEFLAKYEDFPPHMNDLGRFVYLRTYSRYLKDKGRRETFKETIARATNFNINLEYNHRKKLGFPIDMNYLRKEAELLFDNQFNLRQFLSGRTLWVGGSDSNVGYNFPTSNFNCSFINITKWEDLCDLFYLLMVGTGVGFRVSKENISKLPKVRTDLIIFHDEYRTVYPEIKIDETFLFMYEDVALIEVGDSKEGWVSALRTYIDILTRDDFTHIKKIRFNYNKVRPKGERLRTFGGTASGPEPLREMFDGFDKVIKNQLDPTLDPIEVDERGFGNVRPIHILDMGNFIGNNVVVGGVRRTSEIVLFDEDDDECLWAKFGINGYWSEKDFSRLESVINYCKENGINYPKRIESYLKKHYDEKVNVDPITGEPRREEDGSLSPYNLGSGFYHRAMSNNSIAFRSKPSKERLSFIFKLMQAEGEPGFINIEEAARKRLRGAGVYNPSDEVIGAVSSQLGLNPCVPGDTWIMTAEGPRRAKDLIDISHDAIVDGKPFHSKKGMFYTGDKLVYKIKTKEGYELRATSNHLIKKVTKQTQKKQHVEWVPLEELSPGDRVKIANHRGISPWGGEGTFEEGWLLGQMIGNGGLGETYHGYLGFWGESQKELSSLAVSFIKEHVGARSDLTGSYVKSHDKTIVASAGIDRLADKFGIERGTKKCDDKIEMSSYDFYRGFLRGLFDSDGSVQGNQNKGVSIRLVQVDLDRLKMVQRMLLRLGIASTIYTNRNEEGMRILPDGRGGYKEYMCKATHELVISNDNIYVFNDIVGFYDQRKRELIEDKLGSYKRKMNRERFVATIESIELDSIESVYDMTVEKVHEFDANGFCVHNCAEILLDSYGLCNLTTVNVTQFVKDGEFDYEAFEVAQRLSARSALRMTLVDLELPHWDVIQKRDRLLGCSMTGIKDVVSALGWTDAGEDRMIALAAYYAKDEAARFARELRVAQPLLVTTIKPEGTLSQVCGGVSPGLHWSHSPYYIRRIRINAHDPLAQAVRDLGWVVTPENGTPGETLEEKMANASTYVVAFPVKSPTNETKDDISAKRQLETYFRYARYYADHNPSNTISVRPDEWDEVRDIIYDNWNNFVGVSFLSFDGGTYQQPPYEACSEDVYEKLSKTIQTLTPEFLAQYEQEDEEFDIIDSDCEGGACPIR